MQRNTLVTISDNKIGVSSSNANLADFYEARVLSATDYYAFGMSMKGRSWQSERYRYGFNGKENDTDWEVQDYGFRIYKPELAKFLSVDPLTKDYPELTPYQFASNTPIQAIDLDGLEAFFIHGTNSKPDRWNENTKILLSVYTNNKTRDSNFEWFAPLTNNERTRRLAAEQLADYVLNNRKEGEEITLIGHSHGGNVAIQAATIIHERIQEKVNIITLATPAYNGEGDIENPANTEAINDHIHIWNRIDKVQGGLAGEDVYNNEKTRNFEIDVCSHYHSWQWIEAHSFDEKYPNLVFSLPTFTRLKPVEKHEKEDIEKPNNEKPNNEKPN